MTLLATFLCQPVGPDGYVPATEKVWTFETVLAKPTPIDPEKLKALIVVVDG
jgi:hypothetical protein